MILNFDRKEMEECQLINGTEQSPHTYAVTAILYALRDNDEMTINNYLNMKLGLLYKADPEEKRIGEMKRCLLKPVDRHNWYSNIKVKDIMH